MDFLADGAKRRKVDPGDGILESKTNDRGGLQHGNPTASQASHERSDTGSSTTVHVSPASLYHLAHTADEASSRHLQQVFLPSDLQCRDNAGHPPMRTTGLTPDEIHVVRTDPMATSKAVGMLIMALDLLRLGIKRYTLSDREMIAFSLEFAIIAVKLYGYEKRSKGKERATTLVDGTRLLNDAADAIANALAVAQRQRRVDKVTSELYLLRIRLSFAQSQPNAARRMARNLLEGDTASFYDHCRTYLLLLEHAESLSPTDVLKILLDFEVLAFNNNANQVLALIALIKMRFLFENRLWDAVPDGLESLSQHAKQIDMDRLKLTEYGWQHQLYQQYLAFRILWEGRLGNDETVKTLLREMYAAMDMASERGGRFRQGGGLTECPLPPSKHSPDVLVIQSMPLNLLYLMTYLTSVTSRRDYLGSAASCRSLTMPRSMQEFEHVARAEDMWDTNFSNLQGPAEAQSLREDIHALHVEVLLEQATALTFRSSFLEASQTLDKAISLARKHGLFDAYAPHICLVQGQLHHILGEDVKASRSYEAAQRLLQPGSEMGMVLEICKLACEGKLAGLRDNVASLETVTDLVGRCRASSNANLVATGHFLASLTEENRVASKKQLSTAYNVTQRSNNHILRCLIFAFTTSLHLYGSVERILLQLETGRDLAGLMGGKDRSDGVGQLALGLWFAQKLKEYHRREGNVEKHGEAKKLQQRHSTHLERLRNGKHAG